MFEASPQKQQPVTSGETHQLQAKLDASLDTQRRLSADLEESKQRHESEILKLQKKLDKQTQETRQLSDQLSTLQQTMGSDKTDTERVWHQRVSQLQLQAKEASSAAQKQIDELERDLANAQTEQRQQATDSTRIQKDTEAKISSLQEKLNTALAKEQEGQTARVALKAEMREVRARLEVEETTCKALREAAAEAQVRVKPELLAYIVCQNRICLI